MTQGEFETDCRYGQHRILMIEDPVGSKKWKPRNLDRTPHNCRDQKNIQRQKPVEPGQTAFLSDSMDAAVRKIAREEIEKWYSGTQE